MYDLGFENTKFHAAWHFERSTDIEGTKSTSRPGWDTPLGNLLLI